MWVRVLVAATLAGGAFGASADAACQGGATTSFSVTGQVKHPTVFNRAALEKLPVAQENVTYFSAGSVVTESFTGALLWDLLNNPPVSGIVAKPSVKNDILHKIVIVTGSDCYQTVFGAGEIDPYFGGDQVMVAYLTGGQSLGQDGFARIVAPGDKAGGRFVSNIVSIDVEDAGSYPNAPHK
jgi:hypothetical protein